LGEPINVSNGAVCKHYFRRAQIIFPLSHLGRAVNHEGEYPLIFQGMSRNRRIADMRAS
jgi:hypothetical protein